MNTFIKYSLKKNSLKIIQVWSFIWQNKKILYKYLLVFEKGVPEMNRNTSKKTNRIT